jgi:hypothetical protein
MNDTGNALGFMNDDEMEEEYMQQRNFNISGEQQLEDLAN